ncbi:MAG: hypothetical protein IJA10_13330 [Lachnospiraceae bacterium]|nr:hypothetical protein [Lachnospiraceae bacterium]
MSELMKEFFLEFVNTTGLSEEVSPFLSLGGICVIILGIIGCVLGFRTYRMFFSAILFMGTATASFYFMTGTESLRSIATCVAVVGVVLAFFGYRWHRLGGFVLCFLVGMCIGWLLYPSILLAVVCGVFAGMAEIFFPVIAISAMTSLWGAWMLADAFKVSGALQIVTISGIAVISVVWQLFLNRKQKLFTKVCPDRVRYWMEQRRK